MSKMIFQKYKQHAVILGCNDDSEVIYIPEKTDNGLPITEIATAAFRDRYHLRCVVLPSTIHTVGQSAFENCWSLTSIGVGEPGDGNIPTHSVLTVSCIEDCAFKNTALQDITFCNRNVSIGGHAFAFCRDIKGVVFHNCVGTFDGEAAFIHSGIQFLYMPEGEISCLPMETFAQCERLERVVFKTLNGIEYDGFCDCSNLKE